MKIIYKPDTSTVCHVLFVVPKYGKDVWFFCSKVKLPQPCFNRKWKMLYYEKTRDKIIIN